VEGKEKEFKTREASSKEVRSEKRKEKRENKI
jgi:hypothetical protein